MFEYTVVWEDGDYTRVDHVTLPADPCGHYIPVLRAAQDIAAAEIDEPVDYSAPARAIAVYAGHIVEAMPSF